MDTLIDIKPKDGPPISPLNVVRTLGLRNSTPAGKGRPPLRTFDERDFTDLEIEEEDVEREARIRSLRLSLKQVFKDRLMGSANRHRRPSVPPPIPAPPPVVQVSYKLLPLLEDDPSADLGLITTSKDIIQLEHEKDLVDAASKIQLPGEDGEDDELDSEFEAEPVEVEGGIAVTEEAVMQGTADLLTQA